MNGSITSMPNREKREAFEAGHNPKFLVIVDESSECETALVFAAGRAKRTGSDLLLLFIVEPHQYDG